MKIVLLFAAVTCLTGQQDAPTATFKEPFVGFQFSYPKNWTIVKSAKRKDSARTTFSIPVDGSADKAELDVDRTEYHASIDLWQTIQLRANEQLHRTVVRQWTQEILGVSMLFSRIDYLEHGRSMASVAGLYYTRTSQKMFVRLTSDAADFDKVFYSFGHVLETLKQLDGNLPQEDDPSIDLAPAPKKPELAPIDFHPIETEAGNKRKKNLEAPVAVSVVVSTKNLVLRIPQDWTSENVKGNTLDLREVNLSQPVHVELFSLLDSDPAGKALTKLSASHLSEFDKVTDRQDTDASTNKAGCSVAAVWRIGQNSKGDIATCDAMGAKGGYYFLLTYQKTDLVQFKADRKLIELFLKQVSIEQAP